MAHIKLNLFSVVLILAAASGCGVYGPVRSSNALNIKNDIAGTVLEPHAYGGAFRQKDSPNTIVQIPFPGEYMLDFGWGASGSTVDVDVWVKDAVTGEYLGNIQRSIRFPWRDNRYYYGERVGRDYESWDIRSFTPPRSVSGKRRP